MVEHSCMFGEWSVGLMFGKGTVTLGMQLVATPELLM
jgi:hypothetical protein